MNIELKLYETSMNIEVKHYDTLERRLKKTTGEKLNEREYARLTCFLDAINQYKEHSYDPPVLIVGRPAHTTTLIPKDMDGLLLDLGRLPGGVKGLGNALGDLDVHSLLAGRSEEEPVTLVDGFRGMSEYGRDLYRALDEYYTFYRYFYPVGIEHAERVRRECAPVNRDDVFHVGAFDLCKAVGAALPAPPRKTRHRGADKSTKAHTLQGT